MNYNQYQPVMNNTKWEELRSVMLNSSNTHRWRTKNIATGYICPWDGEWFYHFKIDGELESYKLIEWLEVKAETEEIRNEVLKMSKKIHRSWRGT